MEGSQKHQLQGKSISVVTLATFVSKVSGMGREIAMVVIYGRGAITDSYNLAYRIIFLLYLFGSTYVDTTFIPAYAEARAKEGEAGASAFASNILTLLLGFGAVLAAFFSVLPALPIKAIGPLLDPARFITSVQMLRIMLPMLPIMCATSVLSSVLNARRRFLAPQLTALPMNLAIIAACALADVKSGAVLAWATSAGVALQLLFLAPFLKGQFTYRPRLDFSDPRLRATFALAVPALIGGATMELNPIVDSILGSGMPHGAITALSLANKLLAFITGVLLIPLVTVMFSQISGIAAKENSPKNVIAVLQRYMGTVIFIAMPVTVIAILLRFDIVRFMFEYLNFDRADTIITADVFAMYLPGIAGIGMTYLITRTFYALRDTRTPAWCGALSVVINTGTSILLARRMGAAGLALGTSLGNIAGSFILLCALRRKGTPLGLSRTLKQTLLCALCAAAAGYVCHALIGRIRPDAAFFRILTGGGASLLSYTALAALFRVDALRNLLGLVSRRRRRE